MATPDDEVVSRARARLGTVLGGKYHIDRLLGVGGMAAVFSATHLRNTNRVAVKILHSELGEDEGLRARFLREGYAANSVEHPGTVRILDDDREDGGAVFLVMELLEGETLERRWERKGRRLDAGEVSYLMYAVLDVLAAAHAKGIVHRDIKPENLFFTRERTLKVLDFGVARMRQGSLTLTRVGGVLGTPAFMAPEQVLAKAREIDAQSDLWSVGATAFTLLSGRHVHEAETAEEMMVFTASRPAPSLAAAAPDVPALLVEVVDRALRLTKADRWPDARAMQQAVADAYRAAFGGRRVPRDRKSDDDIDDKTAVMTAAELPREVADALKDVPPSESAPPAEAAVVTREVQVLRAEAAPPTDAAVPAPEAAPPERPSTIDGVASPDDGEVSESSFDAHLRARGRRNFFVAALVAFAAILTGGAAIVALRSSPKSPPTAQSAARIIDGPAAATDLPAESVSPSAEPPSIPVEDLPVTTPRGSAATKHPSARPSAEPSTSASSAPPAPPPMATTSASAQHNENCRPAFTIEPSTGKKTVTLDCQ